MCLYVRFAAQKCSVNVDFLNLASASCTGDQIAIGAACTYECKAGYYPAATTMTCDANPDNKTSAVGTWNPAGCAGAWFCFEVFSCGLVGTGWRLYFHRRMVLNVVHALPIWYGLSGRVAGWLDRWSCLFSQESGAESCPCPPLLVRIIRPCSLVVLRLGRRGAGE